MIVYRLDKSVIVHIGLGLIGSAIYKELILSHKAKEFYTQTLNWGDTESCCKIIDQTFTVILNQSKSLEDIELKIVWSAGKVGFLSTQSDIDHEFNSFKSICDSIFRSIEKLNFRSSCFFLLSSAGGLFEGMKCVNKRTEPLPKRPYGHLKLQQEKYLELHEGLFHSIEIYRVSSVFSLNSKFGRRGLINSIINNTRLLKTTKIFGHPSTQRDYIWDKDVAKLIAGDICSKCKNGVFKYILASGIPITIFEIIISLERLLGKSISLNYQFSKSNSEDITFQKSSVRKAQYGTEIDFLLKRAIINNAI